MAYQDECDAALFMKDDAGVNMTFMSLDEAEAFFYHYAKNKGFGVRKEHLKKRAGNVVCYRRFVCCREGFRQQKDSNDVPKKRNRPLTRCGCPVKFSVRLNVETGFWHVKEFVEEHNHELTIGEEVVFLRSHRNIDTDMESDILALEVAGLRKSQIMDVLEQKMGGFKNVGFTMKDLYNFVARHKMSRILEGDAETVLKCMKERKETDVEFFFYYKTNDVGRLSTLFWSDSQSRNDYMCFGDVIAFDSTYRVNRYNMPFIPFVGINHHRSTTIFGCGIVANESAESYEWLLSTFLTAMYQNRPKSVITDGCPSMAKAIREVLPQAVHRICAWHIERNMMRHLHHSYFGGFKALLYKSCDTRDFENGWDNYIASSDTLRDNDWLKMMYKSKEHWASAYLKDKLLLGINSTQRSEGLNARLHMHLDRSMYLFDLFLHYEHCLSHIRRNEVKLDSDASSSVPNCATEFVGLENDLGRIYTLAVFKKIQEELKRSKNYEIVVTEKFGDKMWCELEINGTGETRAVVECIGTGKIESVKCTCKKLECEKIPCRHILRVLIELNIDFLPQFEIGSEIFLEVSKSEAETLKIAEILHQLYPRKNKKQDKEEDVLNNRKDESVSPLFHVSDPNVVVGKGAPKKRIKAWNEVKKTRCGFCRQVGHNIQTCPTIPKTSSNN